MTKRRTGSADPAISMEKRARRRCLRSTRQRSSCSIARSGNSPWSLISSKRKGEARIPLRRSELDRQTLCVGEQTPQRRRRYKHECGPLSARPQNTLVNKTFLTCAIALAVLDTGGYAFAQPNNTPEGPCLAASAAKPDAEKMTLGQRGNARDQRRQMNHRGASGSACTSGQRGAGPDHDLYQGSKLPSADHNKPQNVVDDWRAHHLSAPPPGHHWVQTGADYVLVAIRTGLIAKTLIVNGP